MLEEKEQDLEKVIDICRPSENANANHTVIRASNGLQSVNRVSQYKRDRKQRIFHSFTSFFGRSREP